MARTALAVQSITRAGLEATYEPANVDGHALPNTGRECVHIITTSTPTDITLVTAATVDGQAVADRVVSLAAGEAWFIGPFPRGVYDQPGSEVHLNLSAITGVTIAALRMG